MLTFHIITIFPKMIEAYMAEGILARAIKNKKIRVKAYDLRNFSGNKRGKVDDAPYGGGPGMVMTALPLLRAVRTVKSKVKSQKSKVFVMSPRGKSFDNKMAIKFAKDNKTKHFIIISGRYEGIDARVKKILKATEISTGPYVLSGGEVPAMVLVDAVARHVPGVLGNEDSVEERRGEEASGEVYTRPEVLKYGDKNYRVPKVLLSGNHREITKWRRGKSYGIDK